MGFFFLVFLHLRTERFSVFTCWLGDEHMYNKCQSSVHEWEFGRQSWSPDIQFESRLSRKAKVPSASHFQWCQYWCSRLLLSYCAQTTASQSQFDKLAGGFMTCVVRRTFIFLLFQGSRRWSLTPEFFWSDGDFLLDAVMVVIFPLCSFLFVFSSYSVLSATKTNTRADNRPQSWMSKTLRPRLHNKVYGWKLKTLFTFGLFVCTRTPETRGIRKTNGKRAPGWRFCQESVV